MDRWLRDLDRLAGEASGCPDAVGRSDLTPPPWWSRAPDIATPNLLAVRERVARLRLGLELTDIGLGIRQDGAWDGDIPRPVPSRVCPGDAWIMTRGGDELTVRFGREPTFEYPQAGLSLPLTLRMRAPGSGESQPPPVSTSGSP